MPHPPPFTRAQHARETFPALALLIAATLTGAILFRFPPEHYSFYPQCPIHLLFQLQCPGCGATRAFAALLHGHLTEALRLNALTVCALPVGAACLAFHRLAPVRSRLPRQPSPWLLYGSLAVTALFTIARNL